jgi:hypothetical protein
MMACRHENNGRLSGWARGKGHSTYGAFGTGEGAFPRGSFPPCLIHRVDGIFRPGGGGFGTIFQDVRQNSPEQGKWAAREWLRGDG